MNHKELTEILRLHKLWREGDPSGARANLDGANLAGANLARANLADANLARANLTGAKLAGANLADANLTGANLAGAYLTGAYLDGANLAGAYLTGAYLARADLNDAYLADANLAGAKRIPVGTEAKDPPKPYQSHRSAAQYAERAKRYRESQPDFPVVEALDQKILEAVSAAGCSLDMRDWHTCETTHCRAGWAIHLAGKAGYALEKELGSPEAGRAIYLASTGRTAHFYGSDEAAMADIKRRAGASGV